MRRILERPAAFVVIVLSLFLGAGCGGLFGGPNEQAADAIGRTNEAVTEHNRLFREARATYDEAREALEDGENPEEQAERIARARETLREARGSLEEAREPLSEVQGLAVEDEIKDYTRTLSEAMDAQLRAEAREADFYEVLEGDPILENERRRALDILEEVDAEYGRAEEAYGRAQEIADSNPDLLRRS
jgi:tetratricopeptide (TPR) repeat protein